jgi:hypothetical protein
MSALKSFKEGFKQGYNNSNKHSKPRTKTVKNPVVPPAKPKSNIKKVIASTVIAGLAIATLHAGTPYIALYQAKSTVDSGNKSDIKNMLENHVEFDSVRNDIKDVLTDYSNVFIDNLNKEFEKDLADNPFKDFAKNLTTGLMKNFIPSMINMVVKEITPNNIATAIVNNDSKTDMSNCNIKLISFGKAEYECKNITFVAESNGFTWKVIGLRVTNKEELFNSFNLNSKIN